MTEQEPASGQVKNTKKVLRWLMTIPSQMRTARSRPLFRITELLKLRRVKTRTVTETKIPREAMKMARIGQGLVVSSLTTGSSSQLLKVVWLG